MEFRDQLQANSIYSSSKISIFHCTSLVPNEHHISMQQQFSFPPKALRKCNLLYHLFCILFCYFAALVDLLHSLYELEAFRQTVKYLCCMKKLVDLISNEQSESGSTSGGSKHQVDIK